MPSLGDYEFPDLDPSEAEKIATELVNTFGGEPNNENNFAQAIGHSTANSGAFNSKMADMRRYGLLESRGLRATDLARSLANPKDDQERRSAMFEMFRNIDLLDELYGELEGERPQGELWVILAELTGTERNEAKKVEDKVSKLYNQMLQYEEIEREDEQKVSTDSRDSTSTTETKAPQSGIFVKVGDDEVKLSEDTNANIDLAIQFLKQKKGNES